jgi:hypothetical protein
MSGRLLNRRGTPLSIGLVSMVTLAVVLVPNAAAASVAAPSKEGPGVVSPPHDEVTRRAFELKTAIHDIRVMARSAHQEGFVQASIDPKGGGATVFWHGAPSQDIRRLAAKSTSGIEFVEVPYSLETLRGEAKRISTEYPHVVSAAPSADYRGVDVRVDETATRAPSISSELPVTVIQTKGDFVSLRRDADSMPYWGGTWIVSRDTGESCSTGFAVVVHPAGNEGLTTAAHC